MRFLKQKFNSYKYIEIRPMKNYSKDLWTEKLQSLQYPDYSNYDSADVVYEDFIEKTKATNERSPYKCVLSNLTNLLGKCPECNEILTSLINIVNKKWLAHQIVVLYFLWLVKYPLFTKWRHLPVNKKWLAHQIVVMYFLWLVKYPLFTKWRHLQVNKKWLAHQIVVLYFLWLVKYPLFTKWRHLQENKKWLAHQIVVLYFLWLVKYHLFH